MWPGLTEVVVRPYMKRQGVKSAKDVTWPIVVLRHLRQVHNKASHCQPTQELNSSLFRHVDVKDVLLLLCEGLLSQLRQLTTTNRNKNYALSYITGRQQYKKTT